MKLPAFLIPLLLLASTALPARANDDVIMKALTDEMTRTVKELHIDTHPTPFFVSYFVKEIEEESIASCLGSEATVTRHRNRILTPIVRIGDYDLNSWYPSKSRPDNSYKLPVDDDYSAIRRAVWFNTDYEYKTAVTNYEWKKAYLSANKTPDKLPDMSKEDSLVWLKPMQKLNFDDKKWKTTVEQLSALFLKYPELQGSRVTMIARNINTWIVNSEGTRVTDCQPKYAIIAFAKTQAADGMPIEDYQVVAATHEDQLPDFDKLKEAIEGLAQRVTALKNAPKGEEYVGPVLFEGQGAAEFFSQVMAENFGLAEDPLGHDSLRNPLRAAIGRRILPKYISVIDDPQMKDFRGTPLVGQFDVDDEGVKGQKVTIVEDGVLKNFCQSRLPTKHSAKSNGHSLGGHGVYNVVEIESSKLLSPEELKAQLVELAKDAGLSYIIVVSRMEDEIHLAEYPSATSLHTRPYPTPAYSRQPSDPVVAYRMYLADGRKELVRGLEFRSVSLRAFKDMQTVGPAASPEFIEPGDSRLRHLITPAFLISELELAPVRSEHSSPPILPSDLAAEKK